MKGPATLSPAQLRRFDALVGLSPLILGMDLDGTLAPIVPRPSDARVPAAVARLLRSLARQPGVLVVLVSGRSLADLKKRAPVPQAKMVGLHGISSTVKGVGMGAVGTLRWRAVLRQARRRLRPLGLSRLGVRTEDKGLGLALHLSRPAAQEDRGLPRRLARALSGLPIAVRRGLRTLELRPLGGWDKGRALRRLADACAPAWRRQGACLFAGDDATDEDAFRVLKRMGKRTLSLKIGPGRSAAQWRLGDPAQFWRLLERIYHLRRTA